MIIQSSFLEKEAMKQIDLRNEVLDHYIDQDGLLTVDRDPGPQTTGNGLMHIGFFVALCEHFGMLDDRVLATFKKALASCENEPGLFDRYPGSDTANAHDDYVGVVAGSAILNESEYPAYKRVLERGIKEWYIYNNTDDKQFVKGLDIRNWQWWSFRLRFPLQILWYNILCGRFTFLTPLLALSLLMRRKINYGAILDYMIFRSLNSCLLSKFYWTNKRASDLQAATLDYFKETHALPRLVSLLREKNEQ